MGDSRHGSPSLVYNVVWSASKNCSPVSIVKTLLVLSALSGAGVSCLPVSWLMAPTWPQSASYFYWKLDEAKIQGPKIGPAKPDEVQPS